MANLQEILTSNKLVLVDFTAEWCGPCQMMKPILEKVQAEVGDKVKLVVVDIDKDSTVAAQCMVQSVPTLLLFKDGEQVWRESGILQPQDLVRILENEM
ncbi:thioredoxin [Weeksellaceae bacterium KMM 9713]|uniref:Thioredoxin n=1 Tax=Profundicola chukchiensis TaxID=2961959 RepID=A0A9X4MZZ9_9FLAO|nr:thioredoxin [Profundicola chukchiensis]MDG4946867.1 thioredoxin [Profundicola chukchiensis]MDG4951321.1 thioredoxin [Profundicola chukchiensis]